MSQLKSYPDYKDSGVEWIGEIPDTWGVIKLKHLVTDENTLFMDGDWIESNIIQDQGVRYLTTGNIGSGKFKDQGNSFISEENFNKMNCLKALPNDLAIARLNDPIGRTCKLPDNEKYYVVAVDIVILRPNKNYDKDFLMYCMNTTGYNEKAYVMARGTTMPRISRTGLAQFLIPAISIEEQKSISFYLNQKTIEIDSLISDKKRLLELLEEKRQAVITETVTKGLDPNVNMKNSGIEWIGEIPEHWEVVKLGRISDVIDPEPSHRAPAMAKENGFPYIGIRDINTDGSVNLETARMIEEPSLIAQEKRFTIDNNDIIFCRVATIGFPRIIKKETRMALSATIALIKHDSSKINYLFLLYYLDSLPIKTQSDLFSTGSTRRALGMGVIRKFDIVLPTFNEQIEIVDYLQTFTKNINSLIEVEKATISKLEEYRESLIYEAVTGKIDVRNYASEPEKVK